MNEPQYIWAYYLDNDWRYRLVQLMQKIKPGASNGHMSNDVT